MKRLLILTLILAGFGLLSVSSYIYAQDDGFQPDEYVGVNECGACHRDQTRDHAASPHVLTLQSPDDSTLLADFSQGEAIRTVTLPGQDAAAPFGSDDVALIVGAGRYMQVFLHQVEENQYRILPAFWNSIDGAWQSYGSGENWSEDAAYNWNQSCAGCHVTGLKADAASWVNDGVQCEACHGPGGEHVNLANNLPRSADEADIQEVRDAIVNSPDAQICGQCHSHGSAADGSHPFAIGYLPGQNLSEHFTIFATENADFWWATGHGERKYMQYNEWLISGHAGALDSLKEVENADPACMTCHSEDYRYNQRILAAQEAGDWEGIPPETLTFETAQFGVTCTTCHNPHLVGEESTNSFFLREEPYTQCVACHNDNEITEGIHHPVQEMVEGQPLIESLDAIVPPIPSVHFTAENGPDCLTCHAQRVPVADSPGGRSSHTGQIVMPGFAEAAGLESACAACHADLASPAAMQALIEDTQTGVQARLERIQGRLTGNEPEWIGLALDYVAGDASLGIHNFTYTDALLDAVEAYLITGAEESEVNHD